MGKLCILNFEVWLIDLKVEEIFFLILWRLSFEVFIVLNVEVNEGLKIECYKYCFLFYILYFLCFIWK